MNYLRRLSFPAALVVVGLLAFFGPPLLLRYSAPVAAQTYPTTNPTYIQTAYLPVVTRTTTGVLPSFSLQGQGTYSFRVSGSFATISLVVQVSNDAPTVADGSATWTNVDAFQVGGTFNSSVTASGIYRANVMGMTRVRLSVTTLTGGNLIVDQAATPGPYFRTSGNVDLGAVLSSSAQGAATVTSAQFINGDGSGVVCTFNQGAKTNTPSSTFSIQQYDAASDSYFTLVTSGAITANATPTPIAVYPGSQTASLPSGMVAIGVKLPRIWRVSVTVAGSSPTISYTVGCNMLN